MAYAQQFLYDEIVKLPFDKVSKVLSFVRYLEQEQVNELIIEHGEEEELIMLSQSDDFISSSDLLAKIMEIPND